MNNKNNDSDPFTAEKLQSTYPQITALVNDTSSKSAENSNNDCAPKISSSVPIRIPFTSAPTTGTRPTIPLILKTASSANDKKVPPYTTLYTNDCVRLTKPIPITSFVKSVPKVNPEKVLISKESTITSIPAPTGKLSALGDGKRPQNVQPVRATAQTTSKPADKVIVSSTTTSPEDSKPSSSSEAVQKNAEKVTSILTPGRSLIPSRTVNVFEKNVQTNVLSVTRNPLAKTPLLVRATPSKDAKSADTNAVNISISKATTSTTTTTAATIITTSTTFSPSTMKSTMAKPMVLSTDSLSKNITQPVKSVSILKTDVNKTVSRVLLSPKSDPLVIVTSADSSAKPKSPFPSVSTSPKLQAESFTVPPSSTVKNLKPSQSPGNFQLNSLSEVEKNKDIRNAINSGSTASIGENVTISSAPVEYVYLLNTNVRSMPDPKIRNVSNETTIEAIKQIMNPGSPIFKNKNGSSTEGASPSKQDSTPSSSGASSPGEIRTPKRCEIPALSEIGETPNDNSSTLKKKAEEPVECLTISSDEEEDEVDSEQFATSDNAEVSVSILNKEPQIQRDGDTSSKSYVSKDGSVEKEAESMLETTTGDGFTNLICRTVRIGSYKFKPRNGVTVSKYGLKIVVPPLHNSNDSVAVKIPLYDIIKVLVHYNRSLPVIFYYISPKAGAKIRHLLKMHDSSYFYFDPNSPDESHRRITLLPEKFTDDDKTEIATYYVGRDVLVELTYKEANQLLVKSAPRDIQKTVRLPPNPVQTIMVYPPPPVKGGISINTEDYSCLAEDTYLNDVIIDFYLKFLYHEKLSEEDRQKTHIFSSFFYKRLTDKATPVPRALQNSKSNDASISKAEVRHDRVKKWTKNIDIFSKDYIVIPLNENQHWFLAIICFPGLTGPVRFSDNTPIKPDSSEKSEASTTENSNCSEKEVDSSQTRRIGSTTITPIGNSSYSLTDEEGDAEDRDEADGADEDVDESEFFSGEEDESDDAPGEICPEAVTVKKKPEKEPIKQPCILIFDSLKSASRARIIATLRQYLHVEYKTKHNGEERDFTKNVVKGACPKVPQQDNYTDCGLFVLHYVEMFFEKKIFDFNIPIRILSKWFDPREVAYKRYAIQTLLLRLMEEQKINVDALQLPDLNLSPRNDSDYDYSEELDDYPYFREEEDDGSGMEQMMFEEDDEDEYEGNDPYEEQEEHEGRVRRLMTEEDIDDYMAAEEEEEGEDVESRYAMYNSADEESTSNGNLSDDDDAYRDLDDLDVSHIQHGVHTLIEVTGEGSDDEEILREEEENEEEEEVSDDVEVSEHELRFNNINKENVTICRMPTGSRSGSTATKGQPIESSSTRLEQLKAARPLKKLSEVSIERATEDECPSKKFKSNSQ